MNQRLQLSPPFVLSVFVSVKVAKLAGVEKELSESLKKLNAGGKGKCVCVRVCVCVCVCVGHEWVHRVCFGFLAC